MQALVSPKAVQGIPAGPLLTLLLGVALSATAFLTVDDYLRIEKRRTVFRLCFIQQDIFKGHLVLLTPFQKLALEVHFQIGHLVYVYDATHYLLGYEAFAVIKTPIQIDGADECLEGVSSKVVIMRVVAFAAPKQFVQTYLYSKLAKRFALHDLAAGVRQKPFTLVGEMVEDYLANHSTQHSIAQKLQSLVVDGGSALGVCEHRLVHQRLLIKANLARIESQHITKGAIKLLFLAERQPYRVYQIIGRHSLILRIS